VDAGLLSDGQIRNPEYLTEEMLSERASVEEFLAASFGVCLVHTNEVIGWCLSEYNTGSRCEVGIATREDFRRRGLATKLTWAFIEMALRRGVTRIGWHCSADNLPSGATAVKAGFEKVTDYSIYLGWFDPAIHLTQRGYFALFSEQWGDSLRFFERSFALGDLPDWAYWGAACAAARAGQAEQAFGYLDQAIARGFRDVERLRSSEHLAGLHDQPAWKALDERMASF
jgi:RimJ/RimL family protein N-acetyltransferase